jgi:hypothetical protein
MKTIGIIGSRRRDSEQDLRQLLQTFLKHYVEGDHIVSGGCYKGGDRFAEVMAKTLQIPIKIYYAQWTKLGKCAGFKRNTNIAEDSDILISLVAEDRTGGAEDTITKALDMKKKVVIIKCDGTTETFNDVQKNVDMLTELC